MKRHNFNYLSTGEPTYWLTDAKKIPDLLDFAITNGTADLYTTVEYNLDLKSDHSAVTITISANAIWKETPSSLCNRRANWWQFQKYVNGKILKKTGTRRSCRIYDKINRKGYNDIY
jgi:hypothetical protein